MIARRDLLKATVAGIATGGLPAVAQAQSRRYRIGHTGITWGYAPANAEQAIADVARLGYHGFESFGSVIEYWESRGGIGNLLEPAGLPLIGAYCPMILTDPAVRSGEVARIARWGELIAGYGGTIAVIGPDNVDRDRFDFAASRDDIVATLNELGRALADVGVTGALHQHTGSCIQTRDETWQVMESVDPGLVRLCPDTGELLAAGIDPVDVVREFLPAIAHVHIKDYNGGPTNDGYCPVGTGRVDVAGVIDALETADSDFMIMAELNPDATGQAAPAGELAATSKERFLELGYEFDD